jgi:hypothetical protein
LSGDAMHLPEYTVGVFIQVENALSLAPANESILGQLHDDTPGSDPLETGNTEWLSQFPFLDMYAHFHIFSPQTVP